MFPSRFLHVKFAEVNLIELNLEPVAEPYIYIHIRTYITYICSDLFT